MVNPLAENWAKKFIIHGAHGIRREPASETGKGAMIGRRLIEGYSQKLLKGDPIVDLGFQFGIGVNTEPFLEKEAFQQEQRWIGFTSLVTFPDGIISDEDAINVCPIDSGIDLLHPLNGAVAIERVEKSDIGKGKVGIHFLEAHSSSKWQDLK